MISVVIPAFNEEDSIENIIKELLDVLKKMKLPSFEIILINDGSTDNTLEITKKLNIEVISNPENIGYGFSLKRGIEKAKFKKPVVPGNELFLKINFISSKRTFYKFSGEAFVQEKLVAYSEFSAMLVNEEKAK